MSDLSSYYFQSDEELIADQPIPPITESFDPDHPSVVDRFFNKMYFCRDDVNDEMHTILFHSNRICLIGLDKMHAAVGKGIESINFDIGNCDRSKNQVSGKGKKGGMNLQPLSTLAIIRCVDGSEYKVVSTITGKLIEVNDRLLTNPKLIGVDGRGYIAVILPKIEKCNDIKSVLLPVEEYNERIAKLSESQVNSC